VFPSYPSHPITILTHILTLVSACFRVVPLLSGIIQNVPLDWL
jgi:hypothetical protein